MASKLLRRCPEYGRLLQRQNSIIVNRWSSFSKLLANKSTNKDFYALGGFFDEQRRFLQAVIKDKIVYSPYNDVELQDKSVQHFMFEGFEKYADEECIVCTSSRRSFTFRQMLEMSKKFGKAIAKRGFKAGDTLCISCKNKPEYLAIIVGTLALGGIVTTSNPIYTASELSRQLDQTKSKFLVCEADSIEKCSKASKDLSVQIITLDSTDGYESFEDITAAETSENFPLQPIEDVENTTAFILYSSGTTGVPKGTLITHHNVVSNILQINGNGQAKATTGKTCLGLLPFYHSYGLFVVLLNCVHTGVRVATLSNFTPTNLLEAMSNYKVNIINLVPYITYFLASDKQVPEYDFSSVELLVNAAAPFDASDALVDAVKERFPNAKLTQGFGMTELSPVSHNHPEQGIEPSSVGYPVPNTKCKIIDPKSGELQGHEEIGELQIKGPQVMKGYLKNEEATRATLTDDGWLRTGDVAYYKEDGRFYIVDRIKELIKYKALQISPTELEITLCKHPAVLEAGVAAIPDEQTGELPVALVVLKEDLKESTSTEDLHKFMAEHLAPFKQIHGGIKIVETIPRNSTGKTSRKGIKEKFTDVQN